MNLKADFEQIKCRHSCEVEFEPTVPDPQSQNSTDNGETEKIFNIFDLQHHLSKDCPRSKTCFKCEQTFNSVIELKSHIQYDCKHVMVECRKCKKLIKRGEFKMPSHECVLKKERNDEYWDQFWPVKTEVLYLAGYGLVFLIMMVLFRGGRPSPDFKLG